MSDNWKPKFIQLPLGKMSGAPWNLLDHRGFRVAWCGTDGNHEKDGELIANDLLNLVALGEAVGELNEKATARSNALQAKLDAANARLDAVKKLIKGWRKIERLFEFGWEGYGSAADELEQALKGHDDREVTG